MKIGLLAPQESGKSSFLVALYGVLFYEKSDDTEYPMRFGVPDATHRAWLDEQFQMMVDESLPKADRFPTKTRAQTSTGKGFTEYRFKATHKSSQRAQDVVFIDFPGELLAGALEDTHLQAHHGIRQALQTCDAFIVLLSAPSLAMPNKLAAKARVASSHIGEVLRSALQAPRSSFSKAGVPIAFCPSKLDLLNSLPGGGGRHLETVFGSVKSLFPDFFAESHDHPVLISGLSLGNAIAGKSGEELDPTKKGGPFSPVNIEMAFEFCFSLCAHSACTTNLGTAINWAATRSSELKKKSRAEGLDLVGSLGEWMNLPTWTETPTEYWAREARVSGDIANSREAMADSYFTLSVSLADRLALRSPDQYRAFLSGKRHEFVANAGRGNLPLESIEK